MTLRHPETLVTLSAAAEASTNWWTWDAAFWAMQVCWHGIRSSILSANIFSWLEHHERYCCDHPAITSTDAVVLP